jgi:hypothetical protein
MVYTKKENKKEKDKTKRRYEETGVRCESDRGDIEHRYRDRLATLEQDPIKLSDEHHHNNSKKDQLHKADHGDKVEAPMQELQQ